MRRQFHDYGRETRESQFEIESPHYPYRSVISKPWSWKFECEIDAMIAEGVRREVHLTELCREDVKRRRNP